MQTRVGQPLDPETIDLDMRRIFGRGDFETVNYAIERLDGKRTLVVLVKEKPQRNYVRFGLELEAALGKQADFNVLASHRMKWLNSFGGEWRNDLILGRDVLLQTELYQPLSTQQYFFVSPQAVGTRSIDLICLRRSADCRIRSDIAIAGIDLGVNFLQYGEARVGALVGRRTLYLQSGGVVIVPGDAATVHVATQRWPARRGCVHFSMPRWTGWIASISRAAATTRAPASTTPTPFLAPMKHIRAGTRY